jgi:hypothetical protein
VRTSEQTNEVTAALSKARPQFKPIVKDKTARVTSAKGNYTFDYADLASVMDAVTEALSSNGLAVIQAVEDAPEGPVRVTTRLSHSSGQWFEAELTMPYDAGKPQNKGSAATYARRYGLSGLLGVSSEEDDDGSAAEGNEREVTPRARAVKDDPRPRQAQERKEAAEAVARAIKPVRQRIFEALLLVGIAAEAMAPTLGEWLGRPIEKDTVFTEEDWKTVDQKVQIIKLNQE